MDSAKFDILLLETDLFICRYDRRVIRFDEITRENPSDIITGIQTTVESFQKKYDSFLVGAS